MRSLSTGHREGIGIPIGNLTSQLFANVYLDQLDHFVKERLRVKWYLRYMDDWVILGHCKDRLREIRDEITSFLECHLMLVVNPKRTRIFQVKHGIDWLGWIVYAPGWRRLRQSSIKRTRQRLRRLVKAYAIGDITLRQVSDSIRSWIAHASYGQTYRLRSRLLSRMIL